MEHSSSVDVVSEAGQKHTDVMGKQGIMMLCLLLFFLSFFLPPEGLKNGGGGKAS